ncbi:short chain enoyl-CoA hydratase [Variovorax beijingensis]|uniref:Enoyl-CoA hydratase n=2 Tax=Variovorax TaxID=34072 RepID=A0AAE3XZ05_VARPD|nr:MULTISPECIES: enoyl-CoA hydratase/isomerase family protein [Variovorax]MDP9964610.1 enoyl-CoA hydratase [Variovorax paradoxus]MDR6427509.1 enoyl-CoA hydratase [Variovorax paradoxus]MDR6454672.1 enoyl-CoA hydratase [Variovorax paradoxus]TWD85792.1 short chain enoyl-CoA hydratase [Variovorax beijingensis]
MSIELEVSEYIAVVRLDKPPVNALDRATRRRLIEIFDEVSERADVRVAILTGTGKFFCSGADLKDRPDAEKAGDFLDHNRWTRETGNAIRECAKPVIAAVNGPALGAGFGLMAACDIFLASEDATFAMPEINVGLAGGVSMLRTLFGRSFTRRMFFTGMKVPAAELYRRGVLDEVVPGDRLMPLAMEIAQEIASKAPLAVAYAKQAANMMDLMPQRDGYRFEQNITMALAKTEDAQEARKAFLEKRKPVYQGR